MNKIIPHLWYATKAEEAVRFYVSLLPDSRVDAITPIPTDTPSGPAGSVKVIEFTLASQQFECIEAGPLDPFNHAVSFVINCENQAEIDRLWDALTKDGGRAEQCGWLQDKYGVYWQITPTILGDMMKDKDKAKAKRAMDAMLKMVKLDIAALKKAFDGQ